MAGSRRVIRRGPCCAGSVGWPGVGDRFALWHRAEVTLRQCQHRLRVDIAYYHHRGVVGCVPALIPLSQLLVLQVLQIGHPADHRIAIGVYLIGGCQCGLVSIGVGVVVHAPAAFFLDDLNLAFKRLGIQHQPMHPICLQTKAEFQTGTLQLLVVGCVVGAGEGVFITAVHGDDARELIAGVCAGALEHHVFQGV